jgi:hypothetical protein
MYSIFLLFGVFNDTFSSATINVVELMKVHAKFGCGKKVPKPTQGSLKMRCVSASPNNYGTSTRTVIELGTIITSLEDTPPSYFLISFIDNAKMGG